MLLKRYSKFFYNFHVPLFCTVLQSCVKAYDSSLKLNKLYSFVLPIKPNMFCQVVCKLSKQIEYILHFVDIIQFTATITKQYMSQKKEKKKNYMLYETPQNT